MPSPFPEIALLAALAAAAPPGVLRVCAEPNNLPFSDEHERGFENRIAELIASELGAKLEYTWWAQRRGFFRNTLKAGLCDLVIGVPAGLEMVAATRPYYRSTYVIAARPGTHVASLDDPRLAKMLVGVHLIGDDYSNPPPAHALAAHGLVDNVRGYTLYGDYARPSPPAELLEAVTEGRIDVALVWGPFAGWFAKGHALEVAPLPPEPGLTFTFAIAAGTRRDDAPLRDAVERALAKHRRDVERILDRYGVPRLPLEER